MNNFFENFGVFSLLFLVVYAYIKILKYRELDQASFYDEEDDVKKSDR